MNIFNDEIYDFVLCLNKHRERIYLVKEYLQVG